MIWEPDDTGRDMRTHTAAAEADAVHGSAARLLELARMQAEAGDALQALLSCRAAVARQPADAGAHAAAAIEALECSLLAPTFRAQQARIELAYAHAVRAVALDPSSARAHSALARVLPERSRVSRGTGKGAAMEAILESLAHARRAIALDPDVADAHDVVAARTVEWRSVGRVARVAARMLLGARELDATPMIHALSHAQTAVSLEPRCLRYRYTLARAFHAIGTPASAREHLEVIRDACPVRPSEVAVQRAVAGAAR